MKAIVIGATGATGKEIVKNLLNDQSFNEIIILVRKKSFENHPKLNEIVVDFEHLEQYKNVINADIAFSCLGTTLKIAGSKENQWKVDFDYQLKFAQLAKENNISTFVLLSALGANSSSKIFYSKMKGALEDKIKKLQFTSTYIIKPGSLIRPNTDRMGEKLGVNFIQFFNKIGLLKTYTPITVKDLSKVMITLGKTSKKGIHLIEMKEILNQIKN
jgi:uncharacterized protein YbjT (DUF2867 family)